MDNDLFITSDNRIDEIIFSIEETENLGPNTLTGGTKYTLGYASSGDSSSSGFDTPIIVSSDSDSDFMTEMQGGALVRRGGRGKKDIIEKVNSHCPN